MEDIRLGRKTWTAMYRLTATANTPLQLAPADPYRVSLAFQTVTGTLRVNPGNAADTNFGFLSSSSIPMAEPFTLAKHGDAVTKEWWGFPSATGTVTVFTASLPVE